MKAIGTVGALFFLMLTITALGQSSPISLDRSSGTQKLYMLDESGRVFVSERLDKDYPGRLLVRLPSVLKALDILATKIWTDRELIFITAYGLTTDDPRSRIIEYSSSGDQQCEWILPELSSGLDIDPNEHMVYLTGSFTGTIYSLKLLKDTCYGPRQLNRVTQVSGAQRLGAIVLDPERHLAFVADVLKGSIIRVDLAHGNSLEISRFLGQPVALLYNDDQNQLYIADAAGRRVWKENVNSFPIPSPILLSNDPIFQEPSALVFTSDGKVMVGDRKGQSLITLLFSGAVAKQVQSPP